LAWGGYVSLSEPHQIVLERVEIRLRRLPEAFDGFTIAQLSDIHFLEFTGRDHLESAVETVQRQRPDLVLLTGDFVSVPLFHTALTLSKAARVAEPCAEVLAALEAPFGSIATLGNHDHYTGPEIVTSALQHHGIQVLRKASMPLERDGARIWLVGAEDALFHGFDPAALLRGIPSSETTILALHEPDPADLAARYAIDLQLSGHSHGGQVRLPLIGAPVLPELARKYPMGLYRIRNLQLYTNRGLGVIGVPFRLKCPPEITLITLRKAADG
jgi:predicted MPP superfamily phosphohydrolase